MAGAALIESAFVVVALAVSMFAANFDDSVARYTLIVLLAITMGFQNATARRLGVPNLTTTVLTLTLTGLAADSNWAGERIPPLALDWRAIAAMLLGAALGAAVISHSGTDAALVLALTLLANVGIAAYRLSSSPADHQPI